MTESAVIMYTVIRILPFTSRFQFIVDIKYTITYYQYIIRTVQKLTMLRKSLDISSKGTNLTSEILSSEYYVTENGIEISLKLIVQNLPSDTSLRH